MTVNYIWKGQPSNPLPYKLPTEQTKGVNPFLKKSQPVRSKSKLCALLARLPLCMELKGDASFPVLLPNKRPANPESLAQKQSVEGTSGGEQLAHNAPQSPSWHLTLKSNHLVSVGVRQGICFAIKQWSIFLNKNTQVWQSVNVSSQ